LKDVGLSESDTIPIYDDLLISGSLNLLFESIDDSQVSLQRMIILPFTK
jgi:hypothetical protein